MGSSESKYNRLNSIALLIIALSAVIVAIWQADLTRKHNQLTVKPYLDIDLKINEQVSLTIKNKGEGAAIIKSFQIFGNEEEFSDWSSLFSSVNEDISLGLSRTFEPEDIIGAHEELVLCQLPTNSNKVAIKVRIEYESIYEQHDVFETTFTYGR